MVQPLVMVGFVGLAAGKVLDPEIIREDPEFEKRRAH